MLLVPVNMNGDAPAAVSEARPPLVLLVPSALPSATTTVFGWKMNGLESLVTVEVAHDELLPVGVKVNSGDLDFSGAVNPNGATPADDSAESLGDADDSTVLVLPRAYALNFAAAASLNSSKDWPLALGAAVML